MARSIEHQDPIPLTTESTCINGFSGVIDCELYLICPIATRMRLLPPPCDRQAFLQIGVLSSPVELTVDLGGVTEYFSIVSWPPAEVLNFDVNPSCLLAGIDKLLNGTA